MMNKILQHQYEETLRKNKQLQAKNDKLREANKHYLEVCLERQKLEAELKELREYKLIFDADTALKHVIELRDEIKELKAENKQLKQYREYVMATISRGSMPMEFQEWNQTVDELARDLEEHLKGGD